MNSDRSTDSESIESTSSSSCSDNNFEEFVEDSNEFGIKPYQYEPQLELSNDENSVQEAIISQSNDETEDSRLTSSEWYVSAFNKVFFMLAYDFEWHHLYVL